MFHKPFRVKSSTQMKGSDKKKLKAELKKKFAALNDDALNALIPAKEEVRFRSPGKLNEFFSQDFLVMCCYSVHQFMQECVSYFEGIIVNNFT